MVTLSDTRDRRHPRTMAVATRETVRTNADGTVSVDDPEYVETLKTAGFREADETDADSESEVEADDDLEDLTHGELKAKAEEAGIADEIDLRSKDSIAEALRDRGAE